jgi:hypothetical protein
VVAVSLDLANVAYALFGWIPVGGGK